MFDSDSGHATSGSAGRGSIDPRPSGCLLRLSPLRPPCGLSTQGDPPVKAGGSPALTVIFGDQNSPAPHPQ